MTWLSWFFLCHYSRLFQFLRDPDDPNFHPLKEVITRPMLNYARRLLLVFSCIGIITFTTIWLPIHYLSLVLGVFPLDTSWSRPGDLLIFNLAIPFLQVQTLTMQTNVVLKAWYGYRVRAYSFHEKKIFFSVTGSTCPCGGHPGEFHCTPQKGCRMCGHCKLSFCRGR